jgi:hypothetical protein
VLAPATLAALPSTRAIPDRDVFYVARVPSAPFASRAFDIRILVRPYHFGSDNGQRSVKLSG